MFCEQTCDVPRELLRDLPSNSEGSATTEYTVLLSIVALVAAGAVYAIGPSLLARYELMKMLIAQPFP